MQNRVIEKKTNACREAEHEETIIMIKNVKVQTLCCTSMLIMYAAGAISAFLHLWLFNVTTPTAHFGLHEPLPAAKEEAYPQWLSAWSETLRKRNDKSLRKADEEMQMQLQAIEHTRMPLHQQVQSIQRIARIPFVCRWNLILFASNIFRRAHTL